MRYAANLAIPRRALSVVECAEINRAQAMTSGNVFGRARAAVLTLARLRLVQFLAIGAALFAVAPGARLGKEISIKSVQPFDKSMIVLVSDKTHTISQFAAQNIWVYRQKSR